MGKSPAIPPQGYFHGFGALRKKMPTCPPRQASSAPASAALKLFSPRHLTPPEARCILFPTCDLWLAAAPVADGSFPDPPKPRWGPPETRPPPATTGLFLLARTAMEPAKHDIQQRRGDLLCPRPEPRSLHDPKLTGLSIYPPASITEENALYDQSIID